MRTLSLTGNQLNCPVVRTCRAFIFYMGKRFIDTDLFKDAWFDSLSKDGKLFWLYYITNCDHAGLLKLNFRQITFYTGIENPETVIKELSNRLVTVSKDLIWMPKFFVYQYPNWPEKQFRAANSAYDLLRKLPLDLKSYLTLTEEFINSYGNGKGNGNSNGNKKGEAEKIDETLKKW